MLKKPTDIIVKKTKANETNPGLGAFYAIRPGNTAGLFYRVGQIKWHHFTFLLVTNECINKILWFLAQINYIKQQIAW